MIALALMTALAAEPCGPTLQREVEQASALRVAAAYESLAHCDADRARRTAPAALEKMFGDDDDAIAVIAMVEVDALDSLVPWLERIPPDDRMTMLSAIGAGCAASTARNDFFVTMREQKGDRFYTDRWYRGLDSCRTSEGRDLLTSALESDRFGIGASERGAFLDILEVYARNLRVEGLPLLTRYARELTDPEEIAYVLQIMPRAAGYDTDEGVDAAQAQAVGEAIFGLGDLLDPTRIDIARAALQRIGQGEVADRLVRYRWPDAWRVGGGRYHYAAVLTRSWTCGRKEVVHVHSGEIAEDGLAWPDALIAAAPERVGSAWAVVDAPCDAAPTVEVTLSPTPLKTGDDRSSWLTAQTSPYEGRVRGRKVELYPHEPFAW